MYRRISVMMGVYHPSADTAALERSIRSILAQTYEGFEFLICADGLSEQARRLLQNCASLDDRVTLLLDHGTKRLSQKLNICLAHAKGEYAARMDDDDFSAPERFAKQMAFLTKHPEYAYVGCNVRLTEQGKVVGYRDFPKEPQTKDFLFAMPYIHPALLFRREALEKVGGYCESPSCDRCEDYDLLLRMDKLGQCGYNISSFLFDYELKKPKPKYKYRLNEAIVRWRRYQDLGLLPKALPYVLKPLVVGMIPAAALRRMKEGRIYKHADGKERD